MATRETLTAQDRARLFLLASAIITGLLYVIPYGHYVAYPLMLLSTLAHEMGHGVAAMLTGAEFMKLQMAWDGSGVATWRGNPGAFARAFIAAGGLVGPAVVAAGAFAFGRTESQSRGALAIAGIALVVAALLVVRGPFALGFVAITACLCLFIAFKAAPWLSQVTVVFLGVQLALSVFSRGDYLFTDTARTANGLMKSDVAQMADALFLPYWLWGGLCGAFSILVLVLGMRAFLKGRQRA